MNNNQVKKKKLFKWWQILIIVLMSFTILILCVIAFGTNYNYLDCKSSVYNIKIQYTEKELLDYEDEGDGSYNLREQKTYAKEVGTDRYAQEFTNWFKNNTDGNCTIEENAGKYLGAHVGD